MTDKLELIDRQLLLLINGANTPVLDQIMWFVSEKYTWIPLYIILLIMMLKIVGRNWWILFLGIGLAVGFADSISVHCFKNVVMRYRPTHNIELAPLIHIVNGYHGGWYGFVSSHAANTFAITFFSSLILKRRVVWIAMLAWSLLVCYSRIYIAAHYPADIIGGAILGAACGCLGYIFYKWASEKRHSTQQSEIKKDE